MPCSPGMTRCYGGCLHRQLVRGYQDAVAVWEAEREHACRGWESEEKTWEAENPRPLFKDWLIQSARPEEEA